jgi:serine phosphatase RsbU (regulator of sigma subunit)
MDGPVPTEILFVTASADPSPARAAVQACGLPITERTFPDGQSIIDPSTHQLIILDASAGDASAWAALARRVRVHLGEKFVPILWLADASNASLGLEAGADVCVSTLHATGDLPAQVKALVRLYHQHARLAQKALEAQQLNLRLQQAYQQMDNDLELARRIHRGFLPRKLPEVGQTRFAVCYRPRSRVGGDFYDVFRLDEEHVAFYVADAMGRGIPASSLLTLFLRKTIQAKEIVGRSYRLVPPAEILTQLNRELVGLGLPEPPFVTMIYGVLNCRDGQLTFARAAHPHPLRVPAAGPAEFLRTPGTLLGVFESEYTEQTLQLHPGDKLLLYTDGATPTRNDDTEPDTARLVTTAEHQRHQPVQTFVDYLARDLLDHYRTPDDFTLLALAMGGA